MIVLGFSGIPNGEFYRTRYGLRIVGHDSGVALITGGKVTFACEEERLSRAKHTSDLPLASLRAALDFAGIAPSDVDCVTYTWHATPRRMLNMFQHHPQRIPMLYWPALALA